jgi:hypothetical protein
MLKPTGKPKVLPHYVSIPMTDGAGKVTAYFSTGAGKGGVEYYIAGGTLSERKVRAAMLAAQVGGTVRAHSKDRFIVNVRW